MYPRKTREKQRGSEADIVKYMVFLTIRVSRLISNLLAHIRDAGRNVSTSGLSVECLPTVAS